MVIATIKLSRKQVQLLPNSVEKREQVLIGGYLLVAHFLHWVF
jgi:hypothetical protein